MAVLALVEVGFGLIYSRRGLRLLRNSRFWAFDLGGGSPARVPLRWADLWLVVMLLGCTGVIVAARMW